MKPEKKEKEQKTWWAVEGHNNPMTKDLVVSKTLKDAYAEELMSNGEGKKYAFKITLEGEVTTEIKIIK